MCLALQVAESAHMHKAQTMNKDAKIAILGYGIEGRSMAKYLSKHGHTNLTVCDEREELADLPDHANVQLGTHAFDGLTEFEHVFRSPGIPLTRPDLKSALDSGTNFTSVIKFFFQKCPCQIIGVSGTKGKGTTTSLTHEILKRAGKDSHIGGNIGESPMDFLDNLTPKSIVVLELSSFQLEDLEASPHIAIVLNITRDHLDYHPNVEAYRRSKESLIRFQTANDFAIINGDYEGSRKFATLGEGKKLFYSRKEQPDLPADADAHLDGDKLMVLGEEVGTTADIKLRGTHNYENVLPACMAAKLLGVPNDIIRATLREFKGLPHRLELVCESDGVQYFNDSFSTTPETSIAGIRAFKEPLFLIAGGSEKHSDFKEWARVCASHENLKMVLLMGDTAQHMEEELQDAIEQVQRKNILDVVRVKNLQDAFAFLSGQNKEGAVVLMSPACASFGLFENYKKRGEIFRELANAS